LERERRLVEIEMWIDLAQNLFKNLLQQVIAPEVRTRSNKCPLVHLTR